jgi:hypothetical protein
MSAAGQAMTLAHARAALAAHWRDLIARPGVTGVAVGFRTQAGVTTDEIIVKVFVSRKLPRHHLPPERLVPPRLAAVPGGHPDGHATDVDEAAPPQLPWRRLPAAETALAEARLRVPRRPLLGGVSIAQARFTVGTLALGMRDLWTGGTCLLSCNHVLAQLGQGSIGDPVLQPAPDDGGEPGRSTVGAVLRWVPIAFNPALPNRVDAAIAACVPGTARSFVDGIGPVTGIVAQPELGMAVRKMGRASGLTEGRVVATDGVLKADYAALGYGSAVALYTGQVVTDLACGYGDSGSLVVDGDGRAVGLLFAAMDGSHAWCNPFADVAAALGIGLLPEVA